jgi:hypothetical protein
LKVLCEIRIREQTNRLANHNTASCPLSLAGGATQLGQTRSRATIGTRNGAQRRFNCVSPGKIDNRRNPVSSRFNAYRNRGSQGQPSLGAFASAKKTILADNCIGALEFEPVHQARFFQPMINNCPQAEERVVIPRQIRMAHAPMQRVRCAVADMDGSGQPWLVTGGFYSYPPSDASPGGNRR